MKHVKSVSARFITAAVVMVSVMVIVGTRFVPAIAAGADLARTVNPKGDGVTAGSVPQVTPCTFDLNDVTNHCKGLLKDNSQVTRALLADAEKSLVKDKYTEESFRHGACEVPSDCYNKLYSKTLVMSDARAVDLESLPQGKRVLIGAIAINKPKLGEVQHDDVQYKVGSALPADWNKRTLYFIAESTPKAPIGNDTVIARWTLYGYATRTAADITPLTGSNSMPVSGNVVKCTGHAKTDWQPYGAGFYTCEHVKILEDFAAEHRISFAGVRNAFSCERKMSKGSQAAIREACKTEVRNKLTSLFKGNRRNPKIQDDITSITSAVTKLAGAALNPNSDPYWFSCSVGCCTASN